MTTKITDTQANLMKITRRFTEAGQSPYETIAFRRALSEIKNPDGSTVFRLDGFEVPVPSSTGRSRHSSPRSISARPAYPSA